MSEAKLALRSKYKTLRSNLANRKDLEKLLIQNLLKILDQLGGQKNQSWAVYAARQGEANLTELLKLRPDIQWSFPRIVHNKLEMWRPRLVTGLKPGAYGILEPDDDSQLVPPEQLKGLFVPLVAFDKKGHRLGSGKGFYDRYLQGFNAVSVGVAFECQMHNEDLPVEAHDRSLDFVVTERQILRAE